MEVFTLSLSPTLELQITAPLKSFFMLLSLIHLTMFVVQLSHLLPSFYSRIHLKFHEWFSFLVNHTIRTSAAVQHLPWVLLALVLASRLEHMLGRMDENIC